MDKKKFELPIIDIFFINEEIICNASNTYDPEMQGEDADPLFD